jgi:hypothetical protein
MTMIYDDVPTKGYLSIDCLVMKTHAMEQPVSTQFDSAVFHRNSQYGGRCAFHINEGRVRPPLDTNRVL